ncbi:MAG TPA: hypothetical protein DCO79_13315, partial [Spirochaeta sp.]|nr:hypothetical protein [Spirochaeta sp.]
RFDFYSDEEVFYSDIREFFIAPEIGGIKSIASYPPVLYPGGGGLFQADLDSSGDDCWLRWSLDGKVIAEGAAFGGYGSIEIEAPDAEGVYNLSLEVFPFAPADDTGYDFESEMKKEIPMYVNTEQKSGVNEFGDKDDFYSLFHFRGNLINSADTDLSGISDLRPAGQPALSVRSGMFGYYLDGSAAFEAESLGLPVSDGVLQGFSVMISMIPFGLNTIGDGLADIYYSSLDDGSFSLAVGSYSDGRLNVHMVVSGEVFSMSPDIPMLIENVYTSIALAVQPADDELKMILYSDGEPVSEAVFYPANETVSILNIDSDGKTAISRIGGGVELLIDEFGVYYRESADGAVIDPRQFERSMELEYGKFLMYAEGFDGDLGEIVINNSEISASDSCLTLPPLGEADFPTLYPGYEEVVFRIEIEDGTGEESEAVFYVDGGNAEIAEVDFSDLETQGFVAFSLIFSKDSVNFAAGSEQAGETGFSGDFSGVGYRIKNNSLSENLVIKSILVIRKNISISEKAPDISGKQLKSGINSTENKNRS